MVAQLRVREKCQQIIKIWSCGTSFVKNDDGFVNILCDIVYDNT